MIISTKMQLAVSALVILISAVDASGRSRSATPPGRSFQFGNIMLRKANAKRGSEFETGAITAYSRNSHWYAKLSNVRKVSRNIEWSLSSRKVGTGIRKGEVLLSFETLVQGQVKWLDVWLLLNDNGKMFDKWCQHNFPISTVGKRFYSAGQVFSPVQHVRKGYGVLGIQENVKDEIFNPTLLAKDPNGKPVIVLTGAGFHLFNGMKCTDKQAYEKGYKWAKGAQAVARSRCPRKIKVGARVRVPHREPSKRIVTVDEMSEDQNLVTKIVDAESNARDVKLDVKKLQALREVFTIVKDVDDKLVEVKNILTGDGGKMSKRDLLLLRSPKGVTPDNNGLIDPERTVYDILEDIKNNCNTYASIELKNEKKNRILHQYGDGFRNIYNEKLAERKDMIRTLLLSQLKGFDPRHCYFTTMRNTRDEDGNPAKPAWSVGKLFELQRTNKSIDFMLDIGSAKIALTDNKGIQLEETINKVKLKSNMKYGDIRKKYGSKPGDLSDVDGLKGYIDNVCRPILKKRGKSLLNVAARFTGDFVKTNKEDVARYNRFNAVLSKALKENDDHTVDIGKLPQQEEDQYMSEHTLTLVQKKYPESSVFVIFEMGQGSTQGTVLWRHHQTRKQVKRRRSKSPNRYGAVKRAPVPRRNSAVKAPPKMPAAGLQKDDIVTYKSRGDECNARIVSKNADGTYNLKRAKSEKYGYAVFAGSRPFKRKIGEIVFVKRPTKRRRCLVRPGLTSLEELLELCREHGYEG